MMMWPFGGHAQINTGVDCGSPLNVALRDCQHCHVSRPYRDAQERLLCRDKTRPARAQLIMSWKASQLSLLLLSLTTFAKADLGSCTAGLRLLLQSMCATATISGSLCFWGPQGQRLCGHHDCHPKSHSGGDPASLLLHHQEAQNQLQHTQRHRLP